MNLQKSNSLRDSVEAFLIGEAALLDEWRLDEWLNLFADDAQYVVPTTDLPSGDPKCDLVFINDDMPRLRARVQRLNSEFAHREQPRSRTRRFVSNLQVQEKTEGVVHAKVNVLVYRFRNGQGAPFVGTIEYDLTIDQDNFKIVHRRAVLDNEDLRWHGAMSIIF